MFWIKKENLFTFVNLSLRGYITKTCPCNTQRLLKFKKNENFQWKNFDIFLIFAQNIDCEYPKSMFWSKIKKNRYTPAYPIFFLQKWGIRGYTLHGHVFLMYTVAFYCTPCLHAASCYVNFPRESLLMIRIK